MAICNFEHHIGNRVTYVRVQPVDHQGATESWRGKNHEIPQIQSLHEGEIQNRFEPTAKLLFRLQGVPDFDVERSDGWCDLDITGQVAMLDQFHDIGFVFDAAGRADRPAIELEG